MNTSSPSPDTAIPDSVIVDPGSSLPLNTVGPPKLSASATSVTETTNVAVAAAVSRPVGPTALSLAVTDSVKVSPSMEDGATSARPARSPEPTVQEPPVMLTAPSPLNDQPNGTPLMVTPPSV